MQPTGFRRIHIKTSSSVEALVIFNPYDASTSLDATDQTDIRSANNAMTIGIKSALIILGMLLYLSNVERDAHFYTTILQNEGFPTNNDSIAVGIAGSVIATVFFMPVALFLIWFGIGRCKRLQILPRFDRFTIGWGVLASVLFVLMLLIESNYLIYSIQRPQHWKTITATALYVGYIYLWWCCSLAHGEIRTNKAIHRSRESAVS